MGAFGLSHASVGPESGPLKLPVGASQQYATIGDGGFGMTIRRSWAPHKTEVSRMSSMLRGGLPA